MSCEGECQCPGHVRARYEQAMTRLRRAASWLTADEINAIAEEIESGPKGINE